MDKKLREEIMAEVKMVMMMTLEDAEEKWLSGEQLTEQFGCFTKAWLKSYGSTLPRTQAVITGDDGMEHRSGWCYPMHKINRMLMDGSIKRLHFTK